MTVLTDHDERVLAGVSLAADRRRLARVARVILERDDAVTDLLRVAGLVDRADKYEAAWHQLQDVAARRGGNRYNLLDLVVEIGQQERELRGEPRTWHWPTR
jgi:hypothetical protein